jgi:hypothetical protein
MGIYPLQWIALGHGISPEEDFFFGRFSIFIITLIIATLIYLSCYAKALLLSGNYHRRGSMVFTLTKSNKFFFQKMNFLFNFQIL